MSTPSAVNLPASHPSHAPANADPRALTITFDEVKRKHGLRTHADAITESRAEPHYIIENLLPERQLGVIVGNSGLGKSPALYQLGICAAAGVPFLGEQARETDVLYLDFENGAASSHLLSERIAKFLGLAGAPDNFICWNANDCAPNFDQPGHRVDDIIRDWSRANSGTGRPKLAIVDPLRFWLQQVEDARHSDREVQKAKRVIREDGVGILGVHHLRRVSGEVANNIPLLETDPRSWIQAMSRGASALINGSDVRLGFEMASSKFAYDRGALALAGFRRVHGQFGPIYIERIISEEDTEPLGYKRLTSVDLLTDPGHIAAFQQFPSRFTYTEAERIFGKSASATANLLKKSVGLALLRKEGKNYVKATL